VVVGTVPGGQMGHPVASYPIGGTVVSATVVAAWKGQMGRMLLQQVNGKLQSHSRRLALKKGALMHHNLSAHITAIQLMARYPSLSLALWSDAPVWACPLVHKCTSPCPNLLVRLLARFLVDKLGIPWRRTQRGALWCRWPWWLHARKEMHTGQLLVLTECGTYTARVPWSAPVEASEKVNLPVSHGRKAALKFKNDAEINSCRLIYSCRSCRQTSPPKKCHTRAEPTPTGSSPWTTHMSIQPLWLTGGRNVCVHRVQVSHFDQVF